MVCKHKQADCHDLVVVVDVAVFVAFFDFVDRKEEERDPLRNTHRRLCLSVCPFCVGTHTQRVSIAIQTVSSTDLPLVGSQ